MGRQIVDGDRRSWVLAMVGVAFAASNLACKTPTPSIIARFEGGRFRGCHVFTNWKAEQLVEQCGAPTATFLGADGRSVCYAYESLSLDTAATASATTLAASGVASSTAVGRSAAPGAAFHMVCMSPRFKYPNALPSTIPEEELGRFWVDRTYAISSLPFTSTTSRAR